MPLAPADFLFIELMATSSSLARMLALDYLLIRKERVHRQIGLFRAVGIRLIMARAVRPPLEPPIIKEDLAGIEHLLSFRDRRMPVPVVQKRLALAGPHEVVLLIGNVHAVAVYFVQTVLIGKTIQPENIRRIYRFDSARMQVGVELESLYYMRSGRLGDGSGHGRPWGRRRRAL
jgi:hypothetical protein